MMTRFWHPLFGIDLRTLALFRIMLAITCIVQILVLWPDIFPFIDDRGLFPRKDAFLWNSFYSWSLYYVSGHVVWAHILFILTLLSSLALLVGYRTRIAIVVTWLLMGSLCTRITIFSNGAHMQLPLLLFWAMFLPLGARFSVDAALSKQPRGNNAYLSWATFAILIQEMYLYFFGAMLKTGPSWQSTHDAIYYVTHTYDLSSPLGVAYFGPWWVAFERLLTMYVYYLELFAVVFLFFPLKTAWSRLAILPLLMSLHLGFALFLSIGFFPLVSLTGLIVFIPGLVWDKLLPWWNGRNARAGITLFYDEECNFCRKTCLIFRELGLPPETRILPAQQIPDVAAILRRENSWVVEDGNGVRRTRWKAVAWVWRRSPLLWLLGLLFLPRFMRRPGDCIYAFIAGRRAALGRLSARFLPERDTCLTFQPHEVTQGLILFITTTIMAWNIGHLPQQTLGPFFKPIDTILNVTKLQQQWAFFAPEAHKVTRWAVIEGRTDDGAMVDLLRNLPQAPTHDRPKHGYDAFPNNYWWEFFMHVNYNRARELIGSYFCSAWNESHPKLPVKETVVTVYTQAVSPPLVELPIPVNTLTNFSYDCANASGKSD